MRAISNWPWKKSLAMAGPGDSLRVGRILLDAIRDHCWELGIEQGSMVECLDNRSQWVLVRLPDGRKERVLRDYAWFIAVDRSMPEDDEG